MKNHNKKTLLLVLTALCIVLAMTLVACNGSQEHQHKYTGVVTPPTCTTGGYTTYTCECGESYIRDEVDPIPHSYVNGICAVCKQIDIDSHTHVPLDAEIVNSTAASCTEEGGYDETIRCAECNEVISNTHHSVEKLPHVYESGICKYCDGKIENYANFTANGFEIDYTTSPATISQTVHNTTESIDLVRAFTMNSGCRWELYSDFIGTNKYPLKAMSLEIGLNTAYVIVYYDADTDYFTRYQLNIYRLSMLSYSFNDIDGTPWSYGTLEENSYLTTPPTHPEREYYTFTGWADGDGKLVEFPHTMKTTVALTAKHTPIDYDVTYELNGGTLSTNVNSYHIEKAVVFDRPTKDYYDFAGWYDNAALSGSPVIGIGLGNHGEKTFYAKWTPTVYNITYGLNGGTLNTNVRTYHIEKSVTFGTPTRSYYDFAGWYDNAALSGTAVTGIAIGNHGDKTFYAKWTPKPYNITYNLNGGTLETDANTYHIEKSVTFDEPTKDCYDFAGWYTNSSFSGTAVTGIEIGNYGNKTFYAKWTPTVYDITYELNGGALTTNVNTYHIEKAVTFDNPTKTDYDFAGWYDNEALSGDAVTGITTGNHGNKTYYAKWTPTVYSINYSLSGGSYESELNSFTVEDLPLEVTFGTPTREDYFFGGWYLDSALNNEAKNVVITTTGNKAYYAKWMTVTDFYTFELSSDKTYYTVTAYSGEFEDVVIPSSYKSLPVKGIGESAFKDCTSFTSVTIPNNVTSIGDSAFEGCSGLTSITIPDNVTSIGNSAFSGCINLTTVNWNATACTSAGSLSYSIFADCTNLTTVNIGNNVTAIPNYTFSGCSGLETVYITNITKWCEISFGYSSANPMYYANRLCLNGNPISGDLVIPSGVTTIPAYTFKNSIELTSITIPDSVTSIGERAFYDCSGLTSITIPFVGAKKGGTSNTHFGYIFGASSYNYNDDYVPRSLKEVIITSVTSIGYSAFYGCSGLTSVTIPDSVTSIGSYAFQNCNGLQAVYITVIAKWCEVSFGNLSANPLCYAHKLYLNGELVTDLVISDSVTSISAWAFAYCSGLTSITIPDSVTSIDDSAFDECSGLKEIIVSINNANYASQDGILYDKAKISFILIPQAICGSVTIPDSVTSIGSSAFSGRSGLTSITIPDSVTSIGDSAFSGCYRLVEVYNKSSLSITAGSSDYGYVAYYAKNVYSAEDGSKLTTTSDGFVIYDGTTLIGYIGNEPTITIPSSVTSIGSTAFYECSGLTSITISDSVTSISAWAFAYCSLTSVIIGNSVTSIGEDAFYGCAGLTSVTIPDSVTSIGWYAFDGCTGLTSVYYKGTAADWANISISSGNSPLTSATRYYYSEEEPTGSGNYWHYDANGAIVVWNKQSA